MCCCACMRLTPYIFSQLCSKEVGCVKVCVELENKTTSYETIAKDLK